MLPHSSFPVGVSFDSQRNAHVALRTITFPGDSKPSRVRRFFSVDKYGYGESFQLATDTRKEMEKHPERFRPTQELTVSSGAEEPTVASSSSGKEAFKISLLFTYVYTCIYVRICDHDCF